MLTTPLQVGITGGIGSGKSLVCRVFSLLGVPVYDSDHRAKALMTTDGILISQIKKEFGDLSYDDHGLNRRYLAKTVFGDKVKLTKLNQLVHPRVGADYTRWLSRQDSPYILKEAALLYESGSYQQLDRVIMVWADENVRIKRVLARDPHRTNQQVKDIIKQQWSDNEKRERADRVIYNDESLLLIPQILSLHNEFINSAG